MWIKSYMSYKVEFNLDISDSMQKTLLFINPISSTLIFLGLGYRNTEGNGLYGNTFTAVYFVSGGAETVLPMYY